MPVPKAAPWRQEDTALACVHVTTGQEQGWAGDLSLTAHAHTTQPLLAAREACSTSSTGPPCRGSGTSVESPLGRKCRLWTARGPTARGTLSSASFVPQTGPWGPMGFGHADVHGFLGVGGAFAGVKKALMTAVSAPRQGAGDLPVRIPSVGAASTCCSQPGHQSASQAICPR